MANTETKARRFYRSNLPTIVWDRTNDCPLADFSEGHFTTTNPNVVKQLQKMGYPEIPLNASAPPKNIIVNQPTYEIDGDVPLMVGNNEKAMEKRIELKQKSNAVPLISTVGDNNEQDNLKPVGPMSLNEEEIETPKPVTRKLSRRRKK